MYNFKSIIVMVGLMFSTMSTVAQENITLNIRDVIERPAVFYNTNSKSGIVLVPQSGLYAESWRSLALQLKSKGISALALNSTSVEDIGAAIHFLTSNGVQEVTLMGGSIGGASVLKTLNNNKFPKVKKAILLGSGAGDSSESQGVKKLFIVAEFDTFATDTHRSFRKASEPKELLLFPGAEHGQVLFDGIHKDNLEKAIFEFLIE